MEIQGTLKAIQPVVERGEFKSRKVWITTAENPEYPQTIEIEVNQAKIDLFSGVSIGAPVTCSCNLRGREWSGTDGVAKVSNTIVCWKVSAGVHQPVHGKLPGNEEPLPVDDPNQPLPF